VRLLSRLRLVSGGPGDDELRLRAAGAAGVRAGGFVLRGAARSLGTFLPAPLVNAAIAAGGTLVLAKLVETAGSALASRSTR
jgi:hypothetical protein